jgi:cephalosporin-C deacetylase-like acetyl esterase/lysophospholipase L1-like esterase
MLLLSLAASPACWAQQPTLTPFKAGGIYALGETAGWTVTLPAGTAPSGEYSYTIRKNNFEVLRSGKLDLSQPATIEATVDEPAMLYVEVKAADPAGIPTAGANVGATAGANMGAIVVGAAIAPDQLQPSVPEPPDFDRFWATKIAALQKVPANPVLTPKDSGAAGVEYATLQMDHLDGKHIHGQVAKPERTGKFPGLVIFQWANPPYPLQKQWVTDRAAEGWLAVNIEPHDVLPDQPQSYYDALPQELKQYNTIGREDRDKNYFLQMYLADYRAVDYLASRPDWDGKTLVVMGTSMGGQQSLCTAAFNPKVTGLIVHVPAGADANGPLHGRYAGYPNWPADNPKAMQVAQYFDTVNCAARIKVPSLVSMGFLDTVTPPLGIFVAFNRIHGYKEAVPLVDAAHNHQSTPEQQAPYTTRSTEWLRAFAAGGTIAEPPYKASPRLDRNSHRAHELLLQKRKQGKIDVYFLGDSITRRWGSADEQYKDLLANWNRNFHGWNAADFGWGADKTQNMLWRLENGELDGVNPKVIVLMAGTNNVGRLTPLGDDRARVAEITKGIEEIVHLCRKKAPGATIVLTGITPRNDNIAVMPTIDRINANIARLANGKSIRYLNINDRLADGNGKLLDGMSPDLLHLAPKAYQIWADALQPILTELLGPPASADHAPPPTGDPSTVAIAR